MRCVFPRSVKAASVGRSDSVVSRVLRSRNLWILVSVIRRNRWHEQGYSAEFRRKVLDLLAEGRSVAGVAHDLNISVQTIYNWRRQDRIDRGEAPGRSSAEKGELAAANKRIREL